MNAVSRIAAWRERLERGRAQLRDAFLARPDTQRLLRGLARLTDDVLRDVWRESRMPPAFALLAVGGYGRGRLFPHSDIDVVILLDAAAAAHAGSIERFLATLWDIGLEIAHATRTIDECEREMAADITVRTSLLEHRLVAGAPAPRARVQVALRRRTRHPRVLFCQGPRAAAAPPQVRRRPVQPRAQRQGEPGRAARPADGAVDLQRRRAWPHLARARAQRSHDDGRSAQRVAPGAHDLGDARAAALPRRAARGPAGVRRADGARARAGPRRHADAARERAPDAALLPRGARSAPAQHDPDAEPRRAHPRAATHVDAHRRRLRGAGRAAAHSRPRSVRAAAVGDPRCLPDDGAPPGAQGHVGACAARRGTRAPADRRRVSPRTGESRTLHRTVPRTARHHARVAADEPHRRARRVPAGVRPRRRPDAARPLPRVHGGRAHADGDPQPAPLHRGAARARIPAVLAADRRFRAQGGAVPGGPVPRPRQGPRRRPLGARRARRAALLPPARAARPRIRRWWRGWSPTISRCRRSRRSRTSPTTR